MINKKNSFIGLSIAFAVFTIFTFQLNDLVFDYELENFFPQDDPELAYYREFSKTFGYDNDYLLLGFESQNGIFNTDFLEKIDSDLKKAKNLESTVKIFSPLSLKYLMKSPMGYMPIPLLHVSDYNKLKVDSAKLNSHLLFNEMFISKNGKSLKAILVHERFKNKDEADLYVQKVKTIFGDYDQRVHIAGKAIAQTAFVDAVKKDFSLFIIIAFIIVCICLIIFMKNLKLIFASLSISAFSIVSTIGLMALMGKEIDVLSSLIPTILLVVSLSNIVHLYSHFQLKYQEVKVLPDAIKSAIGQVGLATLLTATTTAIGFLTLIIMNVKPIIDLGIYAASGILIALIVTYLIFPPSLFFSHPQPENHNDKKVLSTFLKYTIHLIGRHKRLILILFATTSIFAVIGISKIQIDAYLVNDLPKNNEVRADFVFFDQEFSGSKPFTMSLWSKSPEHSIFSEKVISEINKIEELVRKNVKVGDILSPVTLVKLANQNLNNTSPAHYQLPETQYGWKKVFQYINKTHFERFFTPVRKNSIAQITGYFQDLGSKDASEKLDALTKELKNKVDHNLLGYRITGTTPLVNKSHSSLSINLIKGLLIAMGIVALIAGMLFRSISMVLITMIPNIIPILFVAGIMGFCGIPLNLSTSVIFAISFGIVVDDTIHFLSQFKIEFNKSNSKTKALEDTISKTGRPIIITTIILSLGFLVFCFSNFNAAFYMGLFVSLSFTIALIADLLLLPVLILMFFKDKKLLNEN